MGALARVEARPPAQGTPGGAVVKSTRDWLASINKPTTKRSYRVGLTDFAAWLGRDVVGEPFGLHDLPVNAGQIVSARGVRRYLVHLEAQGKARATINHRLSTVRKWTRSLEENELIHPHRAEAIYHIRGVGGANKSYRPYLTSDQVQTVLDSIGTGKLIDQRDRALFALLAWTGLRRSEVCGLRIGQYKPVNGYKIIDAVERKGHSTDWVKVPVPLQRALETWWQGAGLCDAGAPMFCAVGKGGQPTGEPLSTNGLYLIVKRRCQAAGFEGITPHALRRSMATNLDLAGAPRSVIQSAGGWKGQAMLDVYIQQTASLDHHGVDYLRYQL